MDHGKTIGSTTKARFTFTLYLPMDQATGVLVNGGRENGRTWRVNWRSLINQDIPVGSKFRCTHSFYEQPFNITVGGPLIDTCMVTVMGLPNVQTYTPWNTVSIGGSVINVARLQQSAWTDTTFAAGLMANESSFICGIPTGASGELSLSFWDVTSNANPPSPLAMDVDNGLHVLRFELVSDV
jgi:hypothetical protein